MPSSHHRGPGFPTLRHLTHVTGSDRREAYGAGSFEVEGPRYAGAFTTVTFAFEIGATGVVEGGGLGVCWRWPFDWHDLQSEDPAGDGHVSVLVEARSHGVQVEAAYERMGGVEPWHHIVTARVRRGRLAAGDRIWLVCGDRTGGGRGWRAPSCASPAMGFVMMVDPDGVREDGGVRWFRLPDPPEFAVAAGPLQRLVAVAPSRAEVGGEASVLLRGEDVWGNPAEVPDPSGDGALRVEASDVEGGQSRAFADFAVERISSSVLRIPIHLDRPGVFDVRVELPGAVPGPPLVASSNPIIVDERSPGGPLEPHGSTCGVRRRPTTNPERSSRSSAASGVLRRRKGETGTSSTDTMSRDCGVPAATSWSPTRTRSPTSRPRLRSTGPSATGTCS